MSILSQTYIYEIAALLAATCWAFGGLVSSAPSAALGAIGFNCVRMWCVSAMFFLYVMLTGTWSTLDVAQAPALFISGFIGIFLGDTALFLTLNRMGPRRTAILFSLNAPASVLLGWLFLGEELALIQVLGVSLTFAGVLLAIAFGKRKTQLHHWENVKGALWLGVLLGLVAALSQSVGSIFIRPVMQAGADPVAVALVRCSIAALSLTALLQLPHKQFSFASPLSGKTIAQSAFSAFLGMGVGMTLLLFALRGGEVGIVSTLSATTPAILLPLLWWRTKEIPALGAWAGACLVVIGCALIFAS
ncbi:DMT family transporter [Polycladidibacter hongkongensis]|uniref:DMT family transporter n=1 Tax=Polycladidibacter hongkongensis TaxID=1647556 RepID=UPI000830D269|nr:DMT family transporter [Pseudovibrio hongkongensis]